MSMVNAGPPPHFPHRNCRNLVDCELVEKCNCAIRHTIREGNQVADRLKKKVGVEQEVDVSHFDYSSIRPR